MTVEARVSWVEGRRLVGQAGSGHAIVVDGGVEKIAPSPMELVLIGMAGCTAMDVLGVLEKKRQAVAGLQVIAHAERAEEHPRVYTAIELEYVVRGHSVKPKAVEDAIGLSMDRYCSVSAMLSTTARVTTHYRIEEVGAE